MHPVSIVSPNSFGLPDATGSDPLRLVFLIRVLPVPAFGSSPVAILFVIREANTISFQYEGVCRVLCSSSRTCLG